MSMRPLRFISFHEKNFLLELRSSGGAPSLGANQYGCHPLHGHSFSGCHVLELPKSYPLTLGFPFAAVAPARLNINSNSTFTGIFKAGSSSPAIIRLSVAKQDPDHFLPGLALKVLIDGKASQNIIAMFSLDGQGKDKNFFANTFWNIIDDPTGFAEKLLAKAFRLALQLLPGGEESRPKSETNLPLVEHASVDNQVSQILQL